MKDNLGLLVITIAIVIAALWMFFHPIDEAHGVSLAILQDTDGEVPTPTPTPGAGRKLRKYVIKKGTVEYEIKVRAVPGSQLFSFSTVFYGSTNGNPDRTQNY